MGFAVHSETAQCVLLGGRAPCMGGWHRSTSTTPHFDGSLPCTVFPSIIYGLESPPLEDCRIEASVTNVGAGYKYSSVHED